MRYLSLILLAFLAAACSTPQQVLVDTEDTAAAPAPVAAESPTIPETEIEAEDSPAATETEIAPPPEQEYRFLAHYGRETPPQPEIIGINNRAGLAPALDENGEQKLDEDGQPVLEQARILEAWFKGYRRPFRVGDRIPDTEWVITEIFRFLAVSYGNDGGSLAALGHEHERTLLDWPGA